MYVSDKMPGSISDLDSMSEHMWGKMSNRMPDGMNIYIYLFIDIYIYIYIYVR